MKVLKRVPWAHIFTCRGCKSELEAEPSDVKQGEFGGVSYGGESGELKFFVRCGVCGDTHTIPDKDVPRDIQNSAMLEYQRGR